jgi:hypothetical protein
LLKAEPENIDRIWSMVFALTGYATVKDFHGEIDEAMDSLGKSVELLEELLRQDVNIRDTTVEILLLKKYLASMMALNGETDEAWAISNAMSEKWLELEGISEEDMRTSLVYIDYLIGRAKLAEIKGNTQLAIQLLGDIQLHLVAAQSNVSFKRRNENTLVRAAFLNWEITGELPAASILSHLPEYVVGSGRTRACHDAGMAVLKAVMLGQDARAREFTDYLLHNGYREASFMKVCQANSLCSGE